VTASVTPELLPLQRLQRARERLADRDVDFTWTFRPPAADDEVARCEALLGMPLAHDVRAFLRQANGGELTERRPEGDSTLSFLSCRGIVAATQELRALLADVAAAPADAFIAVVDYEDGDVLMIDARDGRGTVVDGWHDEINAWHTEAPLARSFTAFADMLLSTVESGSDMKFWLG
jgi:hypothetical protein